MTDRERAITMFGFGLACIGTSVGLLFGLAGAASLGIGFGFLVIGTVLLSAAVWTI
jgi:hypothetical protein